MSLALLKPKKHFLEKVCGSVPYEKTVHVQWKKGVLTLKTL